MNRHLLLGVLLLILCYSTIINQNENKSQLIQGLVLDNFPNVLTKKTVVGLLNLSPKNTKIFNSDGSFTIKNIPLLVIREQISLMIT
jgi:hypothetical protein